MSYYGAINYLYGLQKYGIKLGLEKTGIILSQLGNPQKDFLSIHVAGTNGKGSVSAMTASVLMAHGLKVGLFTSPHLVSFTERIRINNEQLSESDVVSLTEEIKSQISNPKSQIPEPTFFEFVTAMAFLYFSRNGVDWAVIETGMGGRLDATNIITPEVSVITRIGYDHKEFLGKTLTDIAHEKAGIIKKGIPVVSAMQEKEAEDVICKTAKERSSHLFIYEKDFSGTLRSTGLKGTFFDYSDDSCSLSDLYIPLAGEYQVSNACIAIKAVMVALQRCSSNHLLLITPHSSLIRDGLANTKWRGRLEIVSDNPMIMIDGAHNPDAAKALSEFIRKHLNDYRIILIMGIMSDKDISGTMSPLLPLASEIIFTAPNYGRAASPQKLAEIASRMGFSSKVANSVRDAIEIAKDRAKEQKGGRAEEKTSGLILITGSFYTIGEALEILGEKAVLGTLRETI
jgi:dihydrofolate synthase/folylpolyglutamate synthase